MNMNIDMMEVIKIDPDFHRMDPSNEEKQAYSEGVRAWEKNDKKGDRPKIEAKFYSGAEMCRLVMLKAINQAHPTGNRQQLQKLKEIHTALTKAVEENDGILSMVQDGRDFLRSCYARASGWENTPPVAHLVCLVGDVIDQAEEKVEIDRV